MKHLSTALFACVALAFASLIHLVAKSVTKQKERIDNLEERLRMVERRADSLESPKSFLLPDETISEHFETRMEAAEKLKIEAILKFQLEDCEVEAGKWRNRNTE